MSRPGLKCPLSIWRVVRNDCAAKRFNIHSYFDVIVGKSLQGGSKTRRMSEMGKRHLAYKVAGLSPPEGARPVNELGYLNAACEVCTLRASCQRGDYDVPDCYEARWEKHGRLTILLPDVFESFCDTDRILLEARVASDDDFPSGVLNQPVDLPAACVRACM